jgi:tetratricopeptide (TPR) repeat protein
MISYQESNRTQLKCPLCRSETEFHLVQHTLEKASYFIQSVTLFPEESSNRRRLIQCGRREFDRLQHLLSSKRFVTVNAFITDLTKVDLLFYEDKYDEVISLVSKLLDLPLTKMEITTLVIRIAQSLEKQCQYEQAYRVMATLLENTGLDRLSYENTVNFYGVLIRCYYHFGHYEKGIRQGYCLRTMGKYFDSINEHVAYCYRELHRWDDALAVMRKAIRYVEPWNPEMTKKYKDLYEKLLKERETLHEDDLKPE